MNALAHRYSRAVVMIPCTIVSGGLMYLMFAATTVAGTVVFAILYGFFSGGCELMDFSPKVGG